MKALVAGHLRYGRKGGANKFTADNALVCEFHFKPNEKSLKRSTVPCFHEIKGRSSACERITLAIRGTLETSAEGWDPGR